MPKNQVYNELVYMVIIIDDLSGVDQGQSSDNIFVYHSDSFSVDYLKAP